MRPITPDQGNELGDLGEIDVLVDHGREVEGRKEVRVVFGNGFLEELHDSLHLRSTGYIEIRSSSIVNRRRTKPEYGDMQ